MIRKICHSPFQRCPPCSPHFDRKWSSVAKCLSRCCRLQLGPCRFQGCEARVLTTTDSIDPAACFGSQLGLSSGKRKEHKDSLFGPETAGWNWVSSTRSGPPFESCVPWVSMEIFAGMSRTSGGVKRVCVKKVCAHVSFPRLLRAHLDSRQKLTVSICCVLSWERLTSNLRVFGQSLRISRDILTKEQHLIDWGGGVPSWAATTTFFSN